MRFALLNKEGKDCEERQHSLLQQVDIVGENRCAFGHAEPSSVLKQKIKVAGS